MIIATFFKKVMSQTQYTAIHHLDSGSKKVVSFLFQLVMVETYPLFFQKNIIQYNWPTLCKLYLYWISGGVAWQS